jgi:hypothetical protein
MATKPATTEEVAAQALIPYAFPEYGVTIEASSLEEANAKLKEILDK